MYRLISKSLVTSGECVIVPCWLLMHTSLLCNNVWKVRQCMFASNSLAFIVQLFIALHCKFRPQNTMASGADRQKYACVTPLCMGHCASIRRYSICINKNHSVSPSHTKTHTHTFAARTHNASPLDVLHWWSSGLWADVRVCVRVWVKRNCLEITDGRLHYGQTKTNT